MAWRISFARPDITDGVFKVDENDYHVVTQQAVWNMAFSGTFFPSDHFPHDSRALEPVVELTGFAIYRNSCDRATVDTP